MSKIYAPIGYVINHDGKDYYDTNIYEDLLAGALGLAEWPDDIRTKIEHSSSKELVDLFLDNGFELVESA